MCFCKSACLWVCICVRALAPPGGCSRVLNYTYSNSISNGKYEILPSIFNAKIKGHTSSFAIFPLNTLVSSRIM